MADQYRSGDTGLLSEHQSAKDLTNSEPAGYQPSDDEKKQIKNIQRKYEKAKKHKSKYDVKWLDYYKMFRGKQWKEQRPSYRHSEVLNLVFQTIQSTVPIETDARPKITYIPRSPHDTDFCEILNKVCEADWERNNWLYQLTEICYERNFYGTGLGTVYYDKKKNEGLGSICFASADPFYSFPDPDCYDVNTRSQFFIYAEPVSINLLKADYPKFAKFIKPDVTDLTAMDKTNINDVRFKSPVDNKTYLEGNSTGYDAVNTDRALKITLWEYPDEIVEEEKNRLNPDGSPVVDETGVPQKEFVQQKKWPKGRKSTLISGVLVEDEEFEYEDGKIPYARLTNYILPREFWGISEVEQIQSPQKILNKIYSFVLDVLTLMGNPIWVVDNDSDVDTDNLFNRPGLVVEKAKGSEVTRLPGVELQGYVLPLIQNIKNIFDQISGSTDLTRGVEPNDITAASAITSLQEASQTRLRLKSRYIDSFLQDIGQMYASRVLQFYDVPQVFRISGESGANNYFKFHIETPCNPDGSPCVNDDGSPMRVAKVRHFLQDPTTGNISESLEADEYQLRGQFDVKVSTGSSLPFAKSERADKAMKLFQLGVIDDEELLKALDYPNYEAVLQRVNEKKAQMAAQQQQMQGSGGGGKPQPQAG